MFFRARRSTASCVECGLQPTFSQSRIKYQSNSFIQKRLRTPPHLLSSPNFPESRLKWKRIQGTSECSSFSRGLRETSFGGSVFIHPPRTRLHSEIDQERSEARVLDLNIPEAHVMSSLLLNRPKPYLKQKVSESIRKCVFPRGIVVNACRSKRLDHNTLKWPRVIRHALLPTYRTRYALKP